MDFVCKLYGNTYAVHVTVALVGVATLNLALPPPPPVYFALPGIRPSTATTRDCRVHFRWTSQLFCKFYTFLLLWPLFGRVVASLSLLGGQDKNISSIYPYFPVVSLICLKFSSFPSSFWSIPGGRLAHPGRSWLCHCFWAILASPTFDNRSPLLYWL